MAGETPVPEMLRGVWERSRPLIRERIEQLGFAANEVQAGRLTAEDREIAVSNAHKLAGSLGMFGFPKGSEIARSMEELLGGEGLVDGNRLRDWVSQLRSLLAL